MTFPGSQPPQFPLAREEFRRALASGHGRAKLHLARVGVGEFRDEVLRAATECGVFDVQCNGVREDWLTEFVLAAGVERDIIASAIPEESNDCLQRNRLLMELARRACPGAREALYASCRPGGWTSWDAAAEIIELDGDAGLLFVARERGRRCAESEPFDAVGGELWAYDSSRTDGAALAFLATHAANDAHVASYLAAVERLRVQAPGVAHRSSHPRRSLEEMLESFRTARTFSDLRGPGHWGRKATRGELQGVLRFLLESDTEHDLLPVTGALACLGGATLPPLHPILFELTRHPRDKVRFAAARCLSKHAQHGVRVCGLEALARGDLRMGLEILECSAQVDDVETIVAALHRVDDLDEQHGVCWGLLDILSESPEAADPRLALYAYERNPCMGCRERAVQWLVDHDALPAWVAEECAHDANAGIRALVAHRC